MGVFVWWFRRVAEGNFVPVSGRAFDSFYRGDEPFPGDSDRFARFVMVYGNAESRVPVEVRSIQCTKHEVDGAGFFLKEKARREIAETMGGLFGTGADEQNVIYAAGKFIRARNLHRNFWKPTDADIAAIRSAINKKAKRDVL